MNRGVGTGLLTLGIILAVIGALMTYAVRVHTSGFNINTAGVILMIVGIGTVVVSLAVVAMGSRSRSSSEERIQHTPDGQVRRSTTDDWNASV